MSKYLMINHFVKDPNFSNGVSNYIKEVRSAARDSFEVWEKPYDMNMERFRVFIYNKIMSSSKEFDVIECAESQSPCLFLPNTFNVHVRMHCPFYLFKKVIREEPSESRFSDEVRAMYKAKAVSSPSHAMLDLLKEELDVDAIHVYKNPIQNRLKYFKKKNEKNIDVLFFGRFNKLKGNEYIDNIIQLLPESYRIVIAGKQEHPINFSRLYPNVEILDHIEGDAKFDLLSKAKVSISLSKFENCSMAILEALSVGTQVVAWDVGGNSELAPPPLLRLAQLGDIREICDCIKNQMATHIQKGDFEKIVNAINKDFLSGFEHVKSFIQGETKTIYKGLDYSQDHYDLDNASDWDDRFATLKPSSCTVPTNVLLATSNLASARFWHNEFKDKSKGINCKISYRGSYFSEIENIADYNLESDTENLNSLVAAIKKSKAEVLILDNSFHCFINDVYALKNKMNIKIVYSSPSSIIKNSRQLDLGGFGSDSDIYNRRIKAKPTFSQVEYGNVLLRLSHNQKLSEIDVRKMDELLSTLHSKMGDKLVVDFVGSSNPILNIVKKKDIALNLVNESRISIYDYKIIISANDALLANFFNVNNAIFILNKNSIFFNKNIDSNEFQSSYIKADIGTRQAVEKFLYSRDVKNNQLAGFLD